MNQLLIDAYLHTGATVQAKRTITTLLKKSTLSKTTRIHLQLQSFVLDNGHALIDRNDNTSDALLNETSMDKNLLREVILIRGIQQLYYQNVDIAQTLFAFCNDSDTMHPLYRTGFH